MVCVCGGGGGGGNGCGGGIGDGGKKTKDKNIMGGVVKMVWGEWLWGGGKMTSYPFEYYKTYKMVYRGYAGDVTSSRSLKS